MRRYRAAMAKLPCRCGYVHDLSHIPDDGFQVLPDWATEKLLYAQDVNPEKWEIEELRRTTLTRMYVCPNCEALMWESSAGGAFRTYLPNERLPRIYVDFADRDPLGGIWPRHPRTLQESESQHVILRPNSLLTVYDDDRELYAEVWSGVDQNHNPLPNDYVAREVDAAEAQRYRDAGF